mgnify:FL=1
MQLDIYNGFYESNSLPVSAQRLVNAYVHTPETEGAWSSQVIFPSPGLVQRVTTGALNNQNRGAHVMAGVPYFVNGQYLYSVDEFNVATNLGTIPSIDKRVSMSDNGTQLLILIPSGNGYIFDRNLNTLVQITAAGFTSSGNPQYVVYVDSYFVCSTDSKKFIISAVNDGMSWNALDFGSAEEDPDIIVAPWVFKGRLYMAGSETFEPFTNIGGGGFPFQSIQGGLLNVGLDAPYSLVDGRNHFYFIGGGENEKAAIWRTSGQAPERVSTAAIETALQNLTQAQIDSVYAVSYAEEGSYFVGFHLPDTAFYFDEMNNKWHERTSVVDGVTTGWRVASMVEAFGRNYAGDTEDGRIGEVLFDTYSSYDDDYVQRLLITAPFNNEINTFFLPSLQLSMEVGEGTIANPSPQVRMSLSRDGGKSYGYERNRDVGAVGEYGRRVQWRRNGRFDQTAVLKFEFASPTKFVVVRLDAKIRAGVARF